MHFALLVDFAVGNHFGFWLVDHPAINHNCLFYDRDGSSS